ncbi:MAG: PKD domain-containing protein [Proteobacteria bacterium]|nr:PKD domain-containing protein [Pseudomonadota bacterium]
MSLKPLLRWAAAALLLAAGVVSPLTTLAADPPNPAALRVHGAKAAFPELVLIDPKSGGARAVELLGTALPDVAAYYGKSADEFKALLLNDRNLRIDRNGRLFVEDQLEGPLPAATAAEQSVLDGNLLPVDQTFLLHSRPGAKRTIYLNFKGATIAGTAWNSGSTTITALPFDLDGLPYSFNTAELQRIQAIWQRVAEDYAPFDVDVTTEAPAADVLTRSSSADQVFGTTVVITKLSGVYNCSCGGVAYVGAFDEVGNSHKPALVFYDMLGTGNEKYVAEAVSHEAGHNMGLQHDGTATTAYYSGHGSGATGWAPIMGSGYTKLLVQWSKGQYSGANNVQDDYVVMEANGLPIRLDDHGDTQATATILTPTTAGGINSYGVSGVIERPTDVDMFSFSAAAGAVTVTLSPAARSPNLDALIQLRNAAGTVLASANPTDALNAGISFNVTTAGVYYVSVQGVGKGNPATDGYSNYGSLGNYSLKITSLAVANQPPVAVLSATPTSGTLPLTVAFSAAGSSDPDGSIASYLWTFGDGATASGATASRVYSTAGSYTAQLTVTDNLGASSSKTVAITVSAAAPPPTVRVADIAMSVAKSGSLNVGVAAVKVVNGQGAAIAGATVSGTWSGLATGSGSVTTNGSGVASFTSAASGGVGSFVFTVTGVTINGYTYTPAANTETSDSIAVVNQAPTAVLSATPVSGTAPLTVAFSAAGSADADGSIASYQWTFGDGGSASGASASHVYTAAGSYTAQLKVTDNLGLSSTKTTTITVAAPAPTVRIAGITMGLQTAGGQRPYGTAAVTVVNQLGAVVSGATVSGTWSGIASGSPSGVTGSTGTVNFIAAPLGAAGVLTFTVTNVTIAGYTYKPALNTETSDSITR